MATDIFPLLKTSILNSVISLWGWRGGGKRSVKENRKPWSNKSEIGMEASRGVWRVNK